MYFIGGAVRINRKDYPITSFYLSHLAIIFGIPAQWATISYYFTVKKQRLRRQTSAYFQSISEPKVHFFPLVVYP